MGISAANVKELREKTGCGIMDCKKALAEADGDLEAAITFLREKGLASAAKKSGRVTTEGIVYSYIHAGGKVGVLLEVNSETDFVAKTDGFTDLVKGIALHIAAMNPLYIRREEVPAEEVEKERAIFTVQAKESGKPDHIIDKIVDGKVDKFYKEICLLEQPYVKDSDKTIEKLVTDTIAALGENLSIRRFARFKLGEGLEKAEDNFAEEVASMQ
jgi:elongation factor Ts